MQFDVRQALFSLSKLRDRGFAAKVIFLLSVKRTE
jgi:hypothetical protein